MILLPVALKRKEGARLLLFIVDVVAGHLLTVSRYGQQHETIHTNLTATTERFEFIHELVNRFLAVGETHFYLNNDWQGTISERSEVGLGYPYPWYQVAWYGTVYCCIVSEGNQFCLILIRNTQWSCCVAIPTAGLVRWLVNRAGKGPGKHKSHYQAHTPTIDCDASLPINSGHRENIAILNEKR